MAHIKQRNLFLLVEKNDKLLAYVYYGAKTQDLNWFMIGDCHSTELYSTWFSNGVCPFSNLQPKIADSGADLWFFEAVVTEYLSNNRLIHAHYSDT